MEYPYNNEINRRLKTVSKSKEKGQLRLNLNYDEFLEEESKQPIQSNIRQTKVKPAHNHNGLGNNNNHSDITDEIEINKDDMNPKTMIKNQRTQTQILQKLVNKLEVSKHKPKHVLNKDDVWRGDGKKDFNEFLSQFLRLQKLTVG